MTRKRTPAKKRAKTSKPIKSSAAGSSPSSEPAAVPDLIPTQHTFAITYLSNGFNATRAYMAAHPDAAENTARTEGSRYLAKPDIRAFLNTRLEAAWKPYQMGGEQALGRVAVLATFSADERVKLAALRTILEQSGKLKSVPDSIDALAAALRADLEAHKPA